MRSGLEKKVKSYLKNRKIKFKYEPYSIPYTLEAKYTPDFVLIKRDGSGDMLIETKGFFKPSDRRKLLAVKRCNPDLDIRLVFQRDNYLTKAKTSTYSDWARKHGFMYHVGEEIPKAWLKEVKYPS